jgi:hypothetical protein
MSRDESDRALTANVVAARLSESRSTVSRLLAGGSSKPSASTRDEGDRRSAFARAICPRGSSTALGPPVIRRLDGSLAGASSRSGGRAFSGSW